LKPDALPLSKTSAVDSLFQIVGGRINIGKAFNSLKLTDYLEQEEGGTLVKVGNQSWVRITY